MGSCLDLRKYQEDNSMQDAFSKLVSSRPGYKATLEKREPIFCMNEACKKELEPHAKFCPSCGTKFEKKSKQAICMKCYNIIGEEDKFCMSCGSPRPTA
ncbi:MAG: zinc ribbon domain-containing protein [Candidatus Pacearchaeota archaeon]|jgi:rRNA maturation endonuclease Nob1